MNRNDKGKGWHGDPEGHAKAGRKGGKATAEKFDEVYFARIGRKGGKTTSQEHGKHFYQKIGRMGGMARSLEDTEEE